MKHYTVLGSTGVGGDNDWGILSDKSSAWYASNPYNIKPQQRLHLSYEMSVLQGHHERVVLV